MADQRNPASVTADPDELVTLWPALADALQRDHTPDRDERVTSSSGSSVAAPVNNDVLTDARTGLAVTWRHVEAVLCRHCGTTWAPPQYLLPGRLLRHADKRRVKAMQDAGDQTEGAAT